MTTTSKTLFITLFLLVSPILGLNSGSTREIRDQVVAETILDEEITRFCLQYCQGNERAGYLKSLTIDPISGGQYRLVGKAALRNRQVVRDPLEFVLYDHTVIVNTFGTLNPDNCQVRVDNVLIENDFGDFFSNLLRNHGGIVGRVETVPDCHKFLE